MSPWFTSSMSPIVAPGMNTHTKSLEVGLHQNFREPTVGTTSHWAQSWLLGVAVTVEWFTITILLACHFLQDLSFSPALPVWRSHSLKYFTLATSASRPENAHELWKNVQQLIASCSGPNIMFSFYSRKPTRSHKCFEAVPAFQSYDFDFAICFRYLNKRRVVSTHTAIQESSSTGISLPELLVALYLKARYLTLHYSDKFPDGWFVVSQPYGVNTKHFSSQNLRKIYSDRQESSQAHAHKQTATDTWGNIRDSSERLPLPDRQASTVPRVRVHFEQLNATACCHQSSCWAIPSEIDAR